MKPLLTKIGSAHVYSGSPGVSPLADFVLGNLDGSTCDEATMAVVEGALQAAGYSTARNDPFKGVEIIRASGQPARGWHSLQVEVKRSLYMDRQLQKNQRRRRRPRPLC